MLELSNAFIGSQKTYSPIPMKKAPMIPVINFRVDATFAAHFGLKFTGIKQDNMESNFCILKLALSVTSVSDESYETQFLGQGKVSA